MPICLPSAELLEKKFLDETAEVAGWGIFDISEYQQLSIMNSRNETLNKYTK